MAAPIEAPLLGLPAELRNTIWTQLVFHKITDGVVCPVSCVLDTQKADESAAKPNASFLIFTSRERVHVVGGQPVYYTNRLYFNSAEGGRQVQANARQHFERWRRSTNYKQNHYCTFQCLLQPRITGVNRQIRAESLSLFYSINKFHFELENFAISRGQSGHNRNQTPADWWRAIGNHNLSFIWSLNIFGQCFYINSHKGLMIKFRRSPKNIVAVTRSSRRIVNPNMHSLLPDWFLELERWHECNQMEREQLLSGILDRVEAEGPAVHIIEHTAAILEPEDKRYLPDYDMLDGVRYDAVWNEAV